jgi:hypothetical protein
MALGVGVRRRSEVSGNISGARMHEGGGGIAEGKGEERKVRIARTPEELIFYTDTSQSNYPVYLLDTYEVVLKKKPVGAERLVTFHVREVPVVECYDSRHDYFRAYCNNQIRIEDYVNKYSQLPLKQIIDTIRALGLRDPSIETVKIVYEVYRGDYEEFVDEAPGYAVVLIIPPPYGPYDEERKKWAITFSTAKRLLSKLPPDVASAIEKYIYVDKIYGTRKTGFLPYVKIKLPVPTPELERVFSEVKKYLEGVEEAIETEREEEETQPAEIELPEIKPVELEVEPVTAPVTTAVVKEEVTAPAKPELVKIYLLSMKLPSKYLVQTVEADRGVEVRKWEGLAKEIASRLEGIRRSAYEMLRRAFAYVEDYGTWIAVTDEAVEEARRVSEWIREELRKLPIHQVKQVDIDKLYSVKAIPVYLEPEHAKELVKAAIRHLSEDVEELERRIREAEGQRSTRSLKRLQEDLVYRRNLLESLRKFLAKLEQ